MYKIVTARPGKMNKNWIGGGAIKTFCYIAISFVVGGSLHCEVRLSKLYQGDQKLVLLNSFVVITNRLILIVLVSQLNTITMKFTYNIRMYKITKEGRQ